MFIDELGHKIDPEDLKGGDLIFISKKESIGEYRMFVGFLNNRISTCHIKTGIYDFACPSFVKEENLNSLDASFIRRVASDPSGLLSMLLQDLSKENLTLKERLSRVEKRFSDFLS